MLRVLLFLSALNASAAHADGLEEGKLSFCRFGPKIKITHVVVDDKPKGNVCNGSAKIQGVMWECQSPEKVEELVYGYRKNLGKLASDECTRHCESRASHCKAKFLTPQACGLTVDHEDALALGKKFGCRADCSGNAFVYCSLFDAGFQTEDDARMAKESPNCYCSIERE
jgi:hypothetical protein